MPLNTKSMHISLCCMFLCVFPSISVFAQAPEKAQIAFCSNRDGNYEIYVMDTDGNNQRNLTNNPALDMFPSFSPDGQNIIFSTDRDGNDWIYIMDADGNNQRKLTEIMPGLGGSVSATWSPDGKYIAFAAHGSEICIMDVDQRVLTKSLGVSDFVYVGFLSWSPDGKMIAYSVSEMKEGDWTNPHPDIPLDEIYVVDANGDSQRRLASGWCLSWSPDGKTIAFSDEIDRIYIIDVDGNKQRKLTDGSDPAWSSDGQMITFTSDRDGNYEIYVMDADGNNQTRLTNNPAYDCSPDWYDPAYVITAVSPASKLGTTWGDIKAKW